MSEYENKYVERDDFFGPAAVRKRIIRSRNPYRNKRLFVEELKGGGTACCLIAIEEGETPNRIEWRLRRTSLLDLIKTLQEIADAA